MSYISKKQHTGEYKKHVIQEYFDGHRTIQSISEEAHVSQGTVYRWIREYESDSENAFPGSGRVSASDAENIRLKKRIATLEEEVEILKKWMAYTSKTRK